MISIRAWLNLVADTLSRLPYFSDTEQLKCKLVGSGLCCLNILFKNFQGRKTPS